MITLLNIFMGPITSFEAHTIHPPPPALHRPRPCDFRLSLASSEFCILNSVFHVRFVHFGFELFWGGPLFCWAGCQSADRMSFGPPAVGRQATRLLTIASALLLAGVPARAQSTAQPKPLMAEDVFKNVQLLKGIPVNQFMDTMGFFSAALGYNCTNCHGDEVLGNWDKYANDTALKRTARRMVQVANTINQTL